MKKVLVLSLYLTLVVGGSYLLANTAYNYAQKAAELAYQGGKQDGCAQAIMYSLDHSQRGPVPEGMRPMIEDLIKQQCNIILVVE